MASLAENPARMIHLKRREILGIAYSSIELIEAKDLVEDVFQAASY